DRAGRVLAAGLDGNASGPGQRPPKLYRFRMCGSPGENVVVDFVIATFVTRDEASPSADRATKSARMSPPLPVCRSAAAISAHGPFLRSILRATTQYGSSCLFPVRSNSR